MLKYMFIGLVLFCTACTNEVDLFSGESAFAYLEKQCSFGPRNPGSKGHAECKQYLMAELQQFADTLFVQEFELIVPGDSKKSTLTNIIARFNPNAQQQILLGAHWDTRPWADQAFEYKSRPVLGANDGASGVAVLLELAKMFSNNPPSVGVSIVLFDAEDFGSAGNPKTFARGSQHFASNLPIAKPDYAIIIDMVGDAELSLPIERNSFRQNRKLIKELWGQAADLDLKAFVPSIKHTVFDDHVPLFEIAGIPSIDIIDFDYPNVYQNYWHTHEDTPDKCSAESLEQVGTLLVHHIYGIK